MKILTLYNSDHAPIVEFRGLLDKTEYQQLRGYLEHLHLIATETITAPSSVIKTGARKQSAKYFLFPAALRRQHKADLFDFEQMTCIAHHHDDELLVTFRIRKKGFERREEHY